MSNVRPSRVHAESVCIRERRTNNERTSDERRRAVCPWRDRSHVLMWTLRRPQSAAAPHASPCEPPRTNATRTNTRRTPHRTRRTNAERTTDEHTRARSTGVPLKDDARRASVTSPFHVRVKSVARPLGVSIMSVCRPFRVRQKPVGCVR